MKLIFESSFEIPSNIIWEKICNFKKLNFEFFPILKMTSPKKYKELSYENFPFNKFIFNSIVLLFGFIPIEYWKVRLLNAEKSVGFKESSKTIFSSKWIHERKLIDNDDKCALRDELNVTPRIFLFRPILWIFIKILFINRHNRLKKLLIV